MPYTIQQLSRNHCDPIPIDPGIGRLKTSPFTDKYYYYYVSKLINLQRCYINQLVVSDRTNHEKISSFVFNETHSKRMVTIIA